MGFFLFLFLVLYLFPHMLHLFICTKFRSLLFDHLVSKRICILQLSLTHHSSLSQDFRVYTTICSPAQKSMGIFWPPFTMIVTLLITVIKKKKIKILDTLGLSSSTFRNCGSFRPLIEGHSKCSLNMKYFLKSYSVSSTTYLTLFNDFFF